MQSRVPKELTTSLTRTERVALQLADFSSRYLTLPAKAYNTVTMGLLLWLAGGNRMDITGLENLARFGKKDRILFVCNHRTFFDFFVITAVCFWKTKLSRRILFPIRSSFFYDHPLGPLVNASMSGMRMFPPLLRESNKEGRVAFNRWAIGRCIEELSIEGTVMGLHPEGTRNKTDDPYALLPAKPGVGRIALGAEEAHIIPVFVLGPSNHLPSEFVKNWRAPTKNRIDVLFGSEIDLTDLRARRQSTTVALRASQRCMEAIATLADQQKRHRNPTLQNSMEGPYDPM